MAGGKKSQGRQYSRREFVAGGAAVAGGALTSYVPASLAAEKKKKDAYPLSKGYLVYDSRRCSGCQSCMLACSLVHDGAVSTSLSRIQVSRSVLARYPYDIQISVCRQCPDPMCVRNCPTGACQVSAGNGNVRLIDSRKCIGCQACLQACPFSPHRTVWNPTEKKSTKCDLCADAPYFSKKGGPLGNQACVTTCPMGALKLVTELPSQADISGYDVNLAPPPQPKTSPRGPAPTGKPATDAPAPAPKS